MRSCLVDSTEELFIGDAKPVEDMVKLSFRARGGGMDSASEERCEGVVRAERGLDGICRKVFTSVALDALQVADRKMLEEVDISNIGICKELTGNER